MREAVLRLRYRYWPDHLLGEILSKRPEAMQLRYLGTLLNIAGERSNTIVFPLPMGDLAKALGVGEKKE